MAAHRDPALERLRQRLMPLFDALVSERVILIITAAEGVLLMPLEGDSPPLITRLMAQHHEDLHQYLVLRLECGFTGHLHEGAEEVDRVDIPGIVVVPGGKQKPN